MYDDEGNVLVTETQEEFEAAARPDVDPALQNHCIEGKVEWLENGEPITTEVLIPTTPVAAEEAASAQAILGVTLDGVRIDASAPVEQILGAYTIAAFDDCGGHFNPVEGYHLHGAVGCSEVGDAADGDTAQFGYALDGYRCTARSRRARPPTTSTSATGTPPTPSGYHYHANPAAENQVIACLVGQTAESETQPVGRPAEAAPPGEDQRMTAQSRAFSPERCVRAPTRKTHDQPRPTPARPAAAIAADHHGLWVELDRDLLRRELDDSLRCRASALVDLTTLFADGALTSEPTTVDCTLENGSETTCYQLEVASLASTVDTDGPYCPATTSDVGGIWVWDGDEPGLYALDGAFWDLMDVPGL